MRLFGSHFSSPSLTLGNASEVDRVVIPEALLRHYHPLGCVGIGPHSKIWEREIPEIRRKIEIGEGGVKPPEEVEIILAFSLLLPRPLAQLSPPLSTVPTTLLYSYPRALQGFSTHTPAFLGFSDNSGLWSNSNYGEDVIVGVLDTGIWKEHPSFSDSGLDPVPSTWKGACEIGPDFPASSSKESRSPRDTEGHGTHTASTAAGSVVANASLYHGVTSSRGDSFRHSRKFIQTFSEEFRRAPSQQQGTSRHKLAISARACRLVLSPEKIATQLTS
ncbi:hypothetical protein YC2023_010049 [Brassica napus]